MTANRPKTKYIALCILATHRDRGASARGRKEGREIKSITTTAMSSAKAYQGFTRTAPKHPQLACPTHAARKLNTEKVANVTREANHEPMGHFPAKSHNPNPTSNWIT